MAVLGPDVQTAVTDAKVKLAVGPEPQTVQVMSDESDVDAVAVMKRGPDVGLAVAVGVPKLPEVGDAGVPHVAAAGDQPRSQADGGIVETVREDRGAIGFAV